MKFATPEEASKAKEAKQAREAREAKEFKFTIQLGMNWETGDNQILIQRTDGEPTTESDRVEVESCLMIIGRNINNAAIKFIAQENPEELSQADRITRSAGEKVKEYYNKFHVSETP